MGSRGRRDMDGGVEAITDPAERAQVRRQALRVTGRALLWALILTAVVASLPF